jgi:hypothetical protein
MVNGRLKSPVTTVNNAISGNRAHFRHESCVNQRGATTSGTLRSRFGPNDSWSINWTGGSDAVGN